MSETSVLFEMVRRVNSMACYGMLMWRKDPGLYVPVCGTLERSYVMEGGFFSKIPDGTWHCSPSIYHKGNYATYEIHIPYRSRILFHKGNWPTDSDGCILLGEKYTDFDPTPGIQTAVLGDSKEAFDEFMQLTNKVNSFFLKVTSA